MQHSNIRAARRSKGLTQSRLAEKMGTTTQSISNWELGVSVPHYAKLKKLSEILDMPMGELFKCNGESK